MADSAPSAPASSPSAAPAPAPAPAPAAAAPAPSAAPAKSVRTQLIEELHAITTRLKAATEAESAVVARQFGERVTHLFERLKGDVETDAGKAVLKAASPAAK